MVGVYDENNGIVFGGASKKTNRPIYKQPEEFTIGKMLNHLSSLQGRKSWLEMVDFKMCVPPPNIFLEIAERKPEILKLHIEKFNSLRFLHPSNFVKPSKPVFNALYTFQTQIIPGTSLYSILKNTSWETLWNQFDFDETPSPSLDFMRAILIHVLHAISWGFKVLQLTHHDLHTQNILQENLSKFALASGFQTYTTHPQMNRIQVFHVPNRAIKSSNFRIIDVGSATAYYKGEQFCVGISCIRAFEEADGNVSGPFGDSVLFGFDLIRSVPTSRWRYLESVISFEEWIQFTLVLQAMVQW